MKDNKVPVIRKANEFLTAKYKSSLLGQKIIAVSLTRLTQEEGTKYVKAILYPPELRKLLNLEDDTNIYKKLKKISRTLARNVITIEDGRGNFKTFAMITSVTYVDHCLELKFSEDMTPYISKLRKNYTTLQLATLVSFDRASTFRLYEILKKDAWMIEKTYSKRITRRYGLADLKFMLGYVDTNQPYIQEAMANKNYSLDYILENIVRKEDKIYDQYSDFRRRVLDEAQKEMDEKADIRFEYEPEKEEGNKVTSIIFFISWNKPQNPDLGEKISVLQETAITEKPKEDQSPIIEEQAIEKPFKEDEPCIDATYDELLNFLRANGISSTDSFTYDYYQKLMKLAGNDPDAIKKEISYSHNVPYIANFYGWIIKAVKDRYADTTPVEAMNGSTKAAQVMKSVHTSMRSTKIKQDVWNRYKKKENFDDFLDYIGLDLSSLELAYNLDERIKMFADFVTGRL